VHFNDVRMVNLPQSCYFSLHSLFLHAVIQLGLLVYFNREFFTCRFVVARVNLGISSLSNCLTQLIVIQLAPSNHRRRQVVRRSLLF
jgi:hypothetical protein